MVVVRGAAEVRQMLRNLGRKGKAVVSKAQRAGAKLVLNEAKNRAPVVSGRYRRSLTVRSLKRSRKRFGVAVTQKPIEGGKVFYGSFLELGYRTGSAKRSAGKTTFDKRRKIEGRWLMRKAGQMREDEVVGLVMSEINRLIDQEAQ